MKNKVKIIAHCLVKNEQRWIWYSIMSVIDYVDRIIVWDTGSTDDTVKIIKSIKSSKIVLSQKGDVDIFKFTDMRNQMLRSSRGFDWMMVLDGDEVWPKLSIQSVVTFINKNPGFESVVVRTNNLVGDIYHRLPESSGRYQLAGHKGHLNLRFINLKIPGLHVDKPHGQQGYFDKDNTLIQNRSQDKIKFIDVCYHHATHLQRSASLNQDQKVNKRKSKYKYELGSSIPKLQIPEVFFLPTPNLVPRVTDSAPLRFWLISGLLTLPRRIKRILFRTTTGY